MDGIVRLCQDKKHGGKRKSAGLSLTLIPFPKMSSRSFAINPFPKKPVLLCVYSTSLLKPICWNK